MAYAAFLILANLILFYLISWAIGSFYTYLRYKGALKDEEYKKKKYVAMRWVCWGSLIIIGVLGNRFQGIQVYAGIFLAIELVCFCIRKAASWHKPDLSKLIDSAKKQAHESLNQFKPKESASSKEPLHEARLNDTDEYWSLISFAYGKIKQTNIFRLWRKEQFDCQFGKCAICGKPMLNLRYCQVDHIKPRYKKGTNYSNNLALVHKKCNEYKSAKTGYKRPSWIKENRYSEQFDDKVYEITEKVRADYPIKLPDELFEKP